MMLAPLLLGLALVHCAESLPAVAASAAPAAAPAPAATVEELAYTDVRGQHPGATLVLPASGAPRAAVLFVHWLGEPPRNDRSEFLGDARALAGDGIASLTVDQPWAAASWFESRKLADDEAFSDAELLELRQELDLLLSRVPAPAAQHLALVGHDFGGMYGALLAADEPRIATAVIMAAIPVFADWFLLGQKLPPAEAAAYRQRMARFDLPANLARRKAPLATLLQFARGDRYIPEQRANELAAAFPEPRVVQWYDDAHRLDNEKAAAARRQWLREHLLGAAAPVGPGR